MHAWTWQQWQGKPFLRCDLLAAWSHGFFTQQFAPDAPAQLVQALTPALTPALNPDLSATSIEVYRTKQVHGNTVLSASDTQTLASDTEFALADGSYSEAPHQSVWVCSADCTPALIGDITTGQVAAVHAGWRGTAQKIIPIAIAKLQAQGSQLADLRVALGPAIAGEVYQVTVDVAAQVGVTVLPEPIFDSPQALSHHLQTLPQPPILSDPTPERVRLDVRRVNQLQLLQLGLSPDQIAIAPHCTYQEPDNFFSYRRTGQKQVQWSGIVSQS
jgi:polyphenol oxidase